MCTRLEAGERKSQFVEGKHITPIVCAWEDGVVQGSVCGGVQRVPHRWLQGVGAGQVPRDVRKVVGD